MADFCVKSSSHCQLLDKPDLFPPTHASVSAFKWQTARPWFHKKAERSWCQLDLRKLNHELKLLKTLQNLFLTSGDDNFPDLTRVLKVDNFLVLTSCSFLLCNETPREGSDCAAWMRFQLPWGKEHLQRAAVGEFQKKQCSSIHRAKSTKWSLFFAVILGQTLGDFQKRNDFLQYQFIHLTSPAKQSLSLVIDSPERHQLGSCDLSLGRVSEKWQI